MVLLRQFTLAISAAVAALGSLLFIGWNYFYRRRAVFVRSLQVCVCRERQVLVLGLDGAGKSSVLRCLSGAGVSRGSGPTWGFNTVCVNIPGCQLHFLEMLIPVRRVHAVCALACLAVGGSVNLRTYWTQYLQSAHVLVYVVDSADRERLPLAKAELHRLMAADSQLPLVVLGNKQDRRAALRAPELQEALSLDAVGDERKCFLLAVQLDWDGVELPHSLRELQELLLQLLSLR
ncbi:ADP-ribosylation factor-like protein 9 isoform X2 [Huso huso]|uniref:ADP-ribosylation factor-like protein 9 isoform X2 n=1 Tax=Huso huso TaxID=61971 RepID=A0ABR0YQS5_HUSHU